jgi:hypothetical protein
MLPSFRHVKKSVVEQAYTPPCSRGSVGANNAPFRSMAKSLLSALLVSMSCSPYQKYVPLRPWLVSPGSTACPAAHSPLAHNNNSGGGSNSDQHRLV